ncbi:MAG TPA: hypothetical protein VGC18_14400 [Lacisediminihabitans sp.]|uniref:hypothetical protein n=1 Tax=Lacisediminihabitans sp. TaxID=2787631 RepID=UPI002ED7E7F9
MPDNLARTLDDLVRGVPGVKRLYRSASLVADIASVLRPAAADELLVLIDGKDETLTIAVTIAAETSATVTCRTVHDTIADCLLGLGYQDSVVRVTVGQVLE